MPEKSHTDWSAFAGRRLVVLGAGYVGGALAREAHAGGMEVTALTRNPETAGGLEADGVRTVVADLGSDAWHARIEPRADLVVNAVGSSGGGADGYRASYLAGMESMLRWAANGALGTAIFTSATSVYPQREGEWVDESAPSDGCPETARVLLRTERLLLETSAPIQRRLILRLAGIYGPGRHFFVDQLRSGERAFKGDGDYWLNLIHRDDILGAIGAVAAHQRAQGIYNVADGAPEKKREVVLWLADFLGIGREAVTFDAEAPPPRRRQLPGGGRASRRIDPSRLRGETGWTAAHPDFRAGFRAILAP